MHAWPPSSMPRACRAWLPSAAWLLLAPAADPIRLPFLNSPPAPPGPPDPALPADLNIITEDGDTASLGPGPSGGSGMGLPRVPSTAAMPSAAAAARAGGTPPAEGPSPGPAPAAAAAAEAAEGGGGEDGEEPPHKRHKKGLTVHFAEGPALEQHPAQEAAGEPAAAAADGGAAAEVGGTAAEDGEVPQPKEPAELRLAPAAEAPDS